MDCDYIHILYYILSISYVYYNRCFISISYSFIFSQFQLSLPSWGAWASYSHTLVFTLQTAVSKIPFLCSTIWWAEPDFSVTDISPSLSPRPTFAHCCSSLPLPLLLSSPSLKGLKSCWEPEGTFYAGRTPIGDHFPDLSFSLHNWSGGFEMFSAAFLWSCSWPVSPAASQTFNLSVKLFSFLITTQGFSYSCGCRNGAR